MLQEAEDEAHYPTKIAGQSEGKPDLRAEKYRKGGMSLLLKISVKGKGVAVRWGRGRALHKRAR